VSTVAGLINYENKVLAKRGAELIKRLPGLVSAGERIYIGNALLGASLYDEAKREFEAALRDSTELEDHVTARRLLAQVHYVTGVIDKGREEMAAAVREVEQRTAAGYSAVHAGYLNGATEVRWASFEAISRNCGSRWNMFGACRNGAGRRFCKRFRP
jgi:hypothetical protein